MGWRRRVLEKGYKIRLMGGIDVDLRRYYKFGMGDK